VVEETEVVEISEAEAEAVSDMKPLALALAAASLASFFLALARLFFVLFLFFLSAFMPCSSRSSSISNSRAT